MATYKVDRKELLGILKLVSQAKGEKEIVEQMSHFIFTGDDVVCFNDQVCLQHAYDKIEEPFSVKANAFQAILSKIKSKEVSIEINENGVKVNGRTSKALISTQVEDEVSDLLNNLNEELDDEAGWVPLPDSFITAADIASLSVESDASSILSCVYIHNDFANSTDGTCCTRAFLPKDSKLPTFFLKPSTIKILKKIGGVKEMKITPNWIHFWASDDLVLSARILQGKFISDENLDKVFQAKKKTTIKLPEDVLDGLDFVETMVDQESFTASVHIGGKKLSVKTEGELGWAEKEFNLETKQPEISFMINILFLQKILKHTNKLTICEWEDSALIRCSTETFEHMIAPITKQTKTTTIED